MIHEFINKYTSKDVENIINIGRKYYLVNSSLVDIKDKVGEEVFSIGVYLGEVKNNKFMASIELINILSKLSDKKIVVNDKAEWLFVCGRDIFKKSILSGNVKSGKEYFVQNSKDENLGLGKFNGDVVKNIVDKGMYLRMEK
tara:strand:- start:680 stop:1105 length:426 start_codon:yes stop_codon:yes gene_type:complete